MDKKQVLEELQGLSQGAKGRSQTAQLRDVFDGVEQALAAGVSRAAVLEVLHKQGFTLTLEGFGSALRRLRKERKTASQKTESPPAVKPGSTSSPSALPAPTPKEKGQDKPKEEPASPSLPPHLASKKEKADRIRNDPTLTPRQKREKIADLFVTPTSTNHFALRILERQEREKEERRKKEQQQKEQEKS